MVGAMTRPPAARGRTAVRRGCTLAGLIVLAVTMFAAGAGAAAGLSRFAPLDISRLNLIFIPTADTDPATGLMTPRGLQRSLRIAAWLEKNHGQRRRHPCGSADHGGARLARRV